MNAQDKAQKANTAPARDSLLSHLDRNRLVRLMGSSEAATPKIGGKGRDTDTPPTSPTFLPSL